MNILTVDQGSHSVKFVLYSYDRRKVSVLRANEVLLQDILNSDPDLSLDEAKAEVVNEFLKEVAFEGKLMTLLPHHMVTTRFLDIPVANKKKAELMIPFQLDEELPYSSNSLHFAPHFVKQKNGFYVVIGSSNKEDFEQHLSFIERFSLSPHTITTEASIIQGYASTCAKDKTFMLVDIGHSTALIYLIDNQKLVTVYTSYIAGKKIDEAISSSYDISVSEAQVYKHKNSFFLTSDQYEDVSDEQKEFALLMKKVTAPLVQDIKRLELGVRVNQGIEVEEIFLVGGSAQIKNIDDFLSEEIGLPCSLLDFSSRSALATSSIQSDSLGQFYLCQFLGENIENKENLANFRRGEYTLSSSEELPLYSTGFIGVRVIAVCLVFIFTLLVESVMIKLDIKTLNKEITKNLARPVFDLKKSDINRLKRTPEFIASRLKKQNQTLVKEVMALQAVGHIDALGPLFDLHQWMSKTEMASMIHFKSSNDLVELKFTAKTLEDLKRFQQILIDTLPSNATHDLVEAGRLLNVSFNLE